MRAASKWIGPFARGVQQIPKPVLCFSVLTRLHVFQGLPSVQAQWHRWCLVSRSDAIVPSLIASRKQKQVNRVVNVQAQAADARQLYTIFTFCGAQSIGLPAYVRLAYLCSAGLWFSHMKSIGTLQAPVLCSSFCMHTLACMQLSHKSCTSAGS